MALREIRVKEWGNRLVFRYDAESNTIELVERRQKVVIALDDYRPAHLRQQHEVAIGVDFDRIEEGRDS